MFFGRWLGSKFEIELIGLSRDLWLVTVKKGRCSHLLDKNITRQLLLQIPLGRPKLGIKEH